MDTNTVIDLQWLQSADLNDLKSAMRHPGKLAEVNALLQTDEGKVIAGEMLADPDYVPVSKRPVSDEEKEQIAADTAIAEAQAIEDAAEAAAILATPLAPVIEVPAVAPVKKEKIVVDYQCRAEDGTPIGRPTHIEGWTWEEVSKKQEDAHVNAVRYAERVKKNKVNSVETTSKQVRDQAQVTIAEAEAEAAIQEATKDPIKMSEAIRKVTKAERESQIVKDSNRAAGLVVANTWMADHLEDFLPCDANSNFMSKWLQDNNLGLTYDNLELAYTALETKLVKPRVVQPPVLEEPAATAPNVPVAAPVTPVVAPPPIVAALPIVAAPVIPAAPQLVQPALTAPEPTPVAAINTAPATRRPGINGSLPPGSLTAVRPLAQQLPVVSTKAELLKEIYNMPREEYRKKLKTQEFVARLRAAGIPVVGTRN
jgi:hypothetical protein